MRTGENLSESFGAIQTVEDHEERDERDPIIWNQNVYKVINFNRIDLLEDN